MPREYRGALTDQVLEELFLEATGGFEYLRRKLVARVQGRELVVRDEEILDTLLHYAHDFGPGTFQERLQRLLACGSVTGTDDRARQATLFEDSPQRPPTPWDDEPQRGGRRRR